MKIFERATRRQRESATLARMFEIYCHHKEGNSQLCPDCRELLSYALERMERCPLGAKKVTCRVCTIHCYRPDMAERIRVVMRYAGPRMMIYAPKAALRHILRELLHC